MCVHSFSLSAFDIHFNFAAAGKALRLGLQHLNNKLTVVERVAGDYKKGANG